VHVVIKYVPLISSSDFKGGQWLDVVESKQFPGVCEKPIGDFFLNDQDMSWSKHQAACKNKRNARLAEITNASQNAEVHRLCERSSSKEGQCFIGLRKTHAESWQWSTSQTPLEWHNWASKEENNSKRSTNVGAMITKKWADGATLGLIVIFSVALVVVVLSMVVAISASVCIFEGLARGSQCCIITSSSADGTCACLLIWVGLGSVTRPNVCMTALLSIGSGILMVAASSIGCLQFNRMHPNREGEVPMPQQQAIVGQPVVGMDVKPGQQAECESNDDDDDNNDKSKCQNSP